MVWRNGMVTMTHRTTFALDDTTAQRIRNLTAQWKVSQAEVVCRAVLLAETTPPKADPVTMLRQLHRDGGGLTAAVADSYLTEIREGRTHWRGQ
jgi:hypothetical protein